KILHTSDPGARLKQLIDQAGPRKDLTYDKDIKPWLGRRGAFEATALTQGGTGGSYAVIVAAKDTGKAKDFVKKAKNPGDTDQTYRDVKYTLTAKSKSAVGVVKD